MKDHRDGGWDHAWNYFNIHAGQRMSVVNFYLLLIGLLTTGFVTTLERNFPGHWLGSILGLVMVVISYVFWKLDARTSFFVKKAEEGLKELEKELPAGLRIFTIEEAETAASRRRYRLTTYSDCFRAIFWTFGLLGCLAIVFSSSDQLVLLTHYLMPASKEDAAVTAQTPRDRGPVAGQSFIEQEQQSRSTEPTPAK